MTFDEFVTLNDPGKEIQVQPVIPFPFTTILTGKKLTIKIPDTLLKDNTTYRISFGSAIKDLNENNEFKNYNYIFSTGDYFDSLEVSGLVYDAATGKPAADVLVLLHDADLNDSSIVRSKPMYVAKTNSAGGFFMPGLPCRAFRIYALKDNDENLVYDGEDELIGFSESVVFPEDSLTQPITLRIFKELVPIDSTDTLALKTDSLKLKSRNPLKKRGKFDETELRYTIAVDTGDTVKRTYDINKPVKITFNNPVDTYNTERIAVVYDSLGEEMVADITIKRDTTEEILFLHADWKENTLYTIKVYKDFATDTAGLMSLPAAYTFRTKSVDDYGTIKVNVATAYYSDKHVLQVLRGGDTVYNKVVTDTVVTINRLLPEKYELYILVDENQNGKWDTGDLFAKKQPEFVIPFTNTVELKAGWEIVLDFKEPEKKKDKESRMKPSPKTREKPPMK